MDPSTLARREQMAMDAIRADLSAICTVLGIKAPEIPHHRRAQDREFRRLQIVEIIAATASAIHKGMEPGAERIRQSIAGHAHEKRQHERCAAVARGDAGWEIPHEDESEAVKVVRALRVKATAKPAATVPDSGPTASYPVAPDAAGPSVPTASEPPAAPEAVQSPASPATGQETAPAAPQAAPETPAAGSDPSPGEAAILPGMEANSAGQRVSEAKATGKPRKAV